MVFAWDEKNLVKRRKYGVTFETATQIFGGIVILMAVHTVQEANDEEEIRIISARKANSRERALCNPTH